MNEIRKYFTTAILLIVIILVALFIVGQRSFPLSNITQYLPPASSQVAAVSAPTVGLVAHYTFDDGTATDSAGSNNGTVNGATPTAGKIGGALQFDGISNTVSVSSVFATTPSAFTVSAWAKWDKVNVNSYSIASKYNGGGSNGAEGFLMGSYNPGAAQCILNGKVTMTNVNYLTPGQWYHIACVWDGSTLSLYINGALQTSIAASTLTLPAQSFTIGRFHNNSYFPGAIDDVYVYDHAITPEEVAALYALGGESVPPVNGACGPAAKQYTLSETFPQGAYCSSSSTVSPSSPSNPAPGSSSTWSCNGSNGGTNASCTALRAQTDGPTTAILTVTKSGTGTGTVSSTGISCGSDCSETINVETPVTLTASASSDSTFTGWSGGGCSGLGTCTLTLNSNTTVTASFSIVTQDVSIPVINGPTVTAASCNQPDVQAALDTAKTGDTIMIPEGTCTWTSTFQLNKPVTLRGAGVGKTVLINGVSHAKITSCDCTLPQIMVITSSAGGTTRVSNMTLDGGTGISDQMNNGFVKVTGSSKNWRIDHVRFRVTRTSAIHVWAPGGVIDHNYFDIVGWLMAIYGYNGGGTFGDIAWSQPTNLGTDDALYIENNTFYSATPTLGLDGWVGQRVVVRFNAFNNSRVGNHGTESSQRFRGARSYEIYNNTFTKSNSDNYSDGIGVRSGVGVIFNNTLSGSFTMVGSMHNYRDPHPYPPWGQCDGTSPFDLNDTESDGVTTKVYDTGVATLNALTVVNGGDIILTANKSWTTNQWAGYSVWNTRTNIKAPIVSNTPTTITAYTDTTNSGVALSWTAGDSFKIIRATVCLDQVGRGKGDLISGGGSSPTPRAWPNQELDPTYIWNNTLKGVVTSIGDTSVHIVQNRDYFNGMCKPGYTPYTYPHPLVQQQDGVPSQSVPLNCPGGSPTPIAGSCSSALNTCTTGTFSDMTDTTTEYKWSCVGLNGGSTASCSLPISQQLGTTCTSFTYSAWGTCTNGTQTRTITSSLPSGCTGGTPLLTQSCSTIPLVGDFNHDGSVNTLDFSAMSAYWNQNNATYDLNSDGIVNSLDFSILARNWAI